MTKVLIIEDDDVIAQGMARHLQTAGFDAVGVSNGETGLARLRFERPDSHIDFRHFIIGAVVIIRFGFRGRHRWRKALLSDALLRQLRSYRTSALFSESECAGLALAEAVARYTEGAPSPADHALAQARLYFTEAEVTRIAQVAAGEHFFDPATGAVGMDVSKLADPRAMPWDAIGAGIGVRGWQ